MYSGKPKFNVGDEIIELKAEIERLREDQNIKFDLIMSHGAEIQGMSQMLKEQSEEMRVLQAKILLWKEYCFNVLPGRVYQSILDKDLKMRETLNSSEGVEDV